MMGELYRMTLTVRMTALFWLPYVLDRLALRGAWTALSDTRPESGGPHSLWVQRAIKAHANTADNLAIFVLAVPTAQAVNVSPPAARMAVPVYFFARLTNFLIYTAGVSVARTLAFAVAWGAQIVIHASSLNLRLVSPQ